MAQEPEDKPVEEDLDFLYDADPNCKHEIDPTGYSGVKCLHCRGWFCY